MPKKARTRAWLYGGVTLAAPEELCLLLNEDDIQALQEAQPNPHAAAPEPQSAEPEAPLSIADFYPEGEMPWLLHLYLTLWPFAVAVGHLVSAGFSMLQDAGSAVRRNVSLLGGGDR